MTTVSTRDLKDQLSQYLHRAESGERIVVLRGGKPVAALVALGDVPEQDEATCLAATKCLHFVAQVAARYCAGLCSTLAISPDRITGHKATACPGLLDVQEFRGMVRVYLGDPTYWVPGDAAPGPLSAEVDSGERAAGG